MLLNYWFRGVNLTVLDPSCRVADRGIRVGNCAHYAAARASNNGIWKPIRFVLIGSAFLCIKLKRMLFPGIGFIA